MKVFLSSIEGAGVKNAILELMKTTRLKYSLMSFYYIRNQKYDYIEEIRNNSEEVLIDSGAHSFQFGKKEDWKEYTEKYAEFIKNFDRPNVIGYFEMDIDNIIGYEKVLELRNILEKVTDKIIPVWHPNRGIEDYKKMCQDYSGKIIAIGGFAGKEIREEQYIMFVKYAKKYNCKVHCLGMTRRKVLDKVPFDYVDSSSWLQSVVYGRTTDGRRLPKVKNKEERKHQLIYSYLQGLEMQKHYYKKWRKVCKD